jgi:hypothetical protein
MEHIYSLICDGTSGPRGRGKRVGGRLGRWACHGGWAQNGHAEGRGGGGGRVGSCVEKYYLFDPCLNVSVFCNRKKNISRCMMAAIILLFQETTDQFRRKEF